MKVHSVVLLVSDSLITFRDAAVQCQHGDGWVL